MLSGRYLLAILAAGWCCLFSISAHAADASNANENANALLDAYIHSQLIFNRPIVSASDLAGCIVLHKDGKDDLYLNILPSQVKNALRQQQTEGRKPFRHFYSQGEARKAGLLGIFGISTKTNKFVDISITEQWVLEAPSFVSDAEIKRNLIEVGKDFVEAGYTVSYNQSVRYAVLTSSEYTDDRKGATAGYAYVDASGNTYYQVSDTYSKELISISPIDITPLLKKWSRSTSDVAKVADEISKRMQAELANAPTRKAVTLKLHPVNLDVAAYVKQKSELRAAMGVIPVSATPTAQ